MYINAILTYLFPISSLNVYSLNCYLWYLLSIQNERKTVKMMYQKNKFNFGYLPEEKIRVLELPYEERELSMIILLPDETEEDSTGLQKVTHLS